jgi:hypothetical protein
VCQAELQREGLVLWAEFGGLVSFSLAEAGVGVMVVRGSKIKMREWIASSSLSLSLSLSVYRSGFAFASFWRSTFSRKDVLSN